MLNLSARDACCAILKHSLQSLVYSFSSAAFGSSATAVGSYFSAYFVRAAPFFFFFASTALKASATQSARQATIVSSWIPSAWGCREARFLVDFDSPLIRVISALPRGGAEHGRQRSR